MNILEPFKRLTIFEPVEKDGETTEKKVTVGIIYRSDGLYAWDNSRVVPNEYDEAIKWSPASQLPEYAIRRKAIVTKFEHKPLRSLTADDIKLLRLDYASQDDPQLLMEEYLPIKNFELLYGWWKQHYKATLKDCDNPQAIYPPSCSNRLTTNFISNKENHGFPLDKLGGRDYTMYIATK